MSKINEGVNMTKSLIKNKEEFTNLVSSGYTIPQLMNYYNCSRGSIATAKRNFNLVGVSPNIRKADRELGTKQCRVCNTTLTLDAFYSNGINSSGTVRYKPSCKNCSGKERKANTAQLILDYLNSTGAKYECFDCGNTNKYGFLDFHHKDPSNKLFSIGQAVSGTMSKDKFNKDIVPEIEKCVLLCPSCHRLRHI
jgi:hypothetical protein